MERIMFTCCYIACWGISFLAIFWKKRYLLSKVNLVNLEKSNQENLSCLCEQLDCMQLNLDTGECPWSSKVVHYIQTLENRQCNIFYSPYCKFPYIHSLTRFIYFFHHHFTAVLHIVCLCCHPAFDLIGWGGKSAWLHSFAVTKKTVGSAFRLWPLSVDLHVKCVLVV